MYRDKVVSTHPLEKQPLSSYPLKIAAMHHTANTRDKGIYTDMLGALRLLDPEVNNTVDGLCSFMIKDDPILKEGEVSYLWSRLIADDIQKKAQKMANLFSYSMYEAEYKGGQFPFRYSVSNLYVYFNYDLRDSSSSHLHNRSTTV